MGDILTFVASRYNSRGEYGRLRVMVVVEYEYDYSIIILLVIFYRIGVRSKKKKEEEEDTAYSEYVPVGGGGGGGSPSRAPLVTSFIIPVTRMAVFRFEGASRLFEQFPIFITECDIRANQPKRQRERASMQKARRRHHYYPRVNTLSSSVA